MSRTPRDPAGRTGEEGTLRWVVCVVAFGLGLAAYELASGLAPPKPIIIAIATGVGAAFAGLVLLHILLGRLDRSIASAVASAARHEAELQARVGRLSEPEARRAVLESLGKPASVDTWRFPDAPPSVNELASCGEHLAFGLYTFSASEVHRTDEPSGWRVATHDSGHLTIVLLDDARAIEWADDDPEDPVLREHSSLWHALLWAITEQDP